MLQIIWVNNKFNTSAITLPLMLAPAIFTKEGTYSEHPMDKLWHKHAP